MARKPKPQPTSTEDFEKLMAVIAGFDDTQLTATIETANALMEKAKKAKLKEKKAQLEALKAEIAELEK